MEMQIASLLTKANIPFKRQASVNGLLQDIAIKSPKGHVITLDLNEAPSAGTAFKDIKIDFDYTRKYAGLAKKVTGADGAFIVMNGLKKSQPELGVLSPEDVAKFVLAFDEPPRSESEITIPKSVVAVAMPFADAYDDAFDAIVQSVMNAGGAARRADRDQYAGNVMAHVEKLIRESNGLVADLSGANPNVLYEMGFARGVDKTVVPVSSTPLKDLPFDVAQLNVLKYEAGRTRKLIPPLTERLKEVLPRV